MPRTLPGDKNTLLHTHSHHSNRPFEKINPGEENPEPHPLRYDLRNGAPEAHAEWGLYKILEFMGLHEILPPGAGKNRAKLRKDIEEYHTVYAIDFDDSIRHFYCPKAGRSGL